MKINIGIHRFRSLLPSSSYKIHHPRTAALIKLLCRPFQSVGCPETRGEIELRLYKKTQLRREASTSSKTSDRSLGWKPERRNDQRKREKEQNARRRGGEREKKEEWGEKRREQRRTKGMKKKKKERKKEPAWKNYRKEADQGRGRGGGGEKNALSWKRILLSKPRGLLARTSLSCPRLTG